MAKTKSASSKPGKRSTGATVASVATPPAKKFFRSHGGTWIECDYDAAQEVYDNCHEVPASSVPASQGGTGPG